MLDIDKIEVGFEVKQRSIVHIPPGQLGGNHKHPRTEAFIGIGRELELVWKENEKLIKEMMNPGGQLVLFTIPPQVEHAVKNKSEAENGMLIELADAEQDLVEVCKLI